MHAIPREKKAHTKRRASNALAVEWSCMRPHLVVLLLFVAAGVYADPSHALQPDDLIGEWHAKDTTWERMNDYDLEAGASKKVITPNNGSDDFVIVRRGRFFFKTAVGAKPGDATILSLNAGSNGELISSDDAFRFVFTPVGARLRVENTVKGAGGGSVTGVYTRVAGFTGAGVPEPMQSIHVRGGYKEFKALVGLDRVIVQCEFRNPNPMVLTVHVIGQFITQNRGNRQDEDDVAIPAGAARGRTFTFNNIDLGRAGSVRSNCDVTSPDGIPVESF